MASRFTRLLQSSCLLASAVPALVAPSAEAAPAPLVSYQWHNVAIGGGGFVTGLVYHPRERDLLYARTDVGGAYRWDAARLEWTALNDAIGAEHSDQLGVLSLAVDPSDAARLYLACGSYTSGWGGDASVMRSADRGRTWQSSPLSFKLGGNEDGRSTGERLQVNPADGRMLLLGTTKDGLWKSDDAAVSWRAVPSLPAAQVTLVLFVPTGQKTMSVYVGTADAGRPTLYRSDDDAKSWHAVAGAPAGLIPHHAAADARGTVYLAYANRLGPNGVTTGAVWKLDSTTGRWTEVTPLHPGATAGDNFGYAGLAVDANHEDTVLVSTLDRWHAGDEVFRTTDGGRTWRPLLAGARWEIASAPYVADLTPHWIGSVAINPFAESEAWLTTGYGVWQSGDMTAADRGSPLNWQFADRGLEETVVDELVSPSEGPPLFSAILDLGGFRHDELERSPTTGSFQPFRGSSTSIAVAARAPNVLVRTTSGPTGGAISRDGGWKWTEFSSSPLAKPGHEVGALALSADGRTIVWLPKRSAPFYSTDDGRSWRASHGAFDSTGDYFIDRPVADPLDAEIFYLYESGAGRVYASCDRGVNFAMVGRIAAKGGTMRCEPGSSGRLWIATPHGLFRSEDGGRYFAGVSGVEMAGPFGFGGGATDRAPPVVYLAAKIAGKFGIYRSEDLGATWQRITTDEQRYGWMRAVTGDPRRYGRVYLGTSGRGILYGDPAP